MDPPPPPAETAAPYAPAASGQLLLAVHTVDAATAKVPFSLILLLDYARRRATPPGSKCRMVIPSDGITSMSLWDSTDRPGLERWLADNLGTDCTTKLHEVQEDFTYGVSLELARMRAAEKVADGSLKTIGALGERTSRAAELVAAGVTNAVGTTQQRLEAWDQRTGVLTTAKETTAALQQRVATAVSRAAEDERVAGVVTGVTTGVATGWAKVSQWVGSRLQDMHMHDGDEYAQTWQQQGQQQQQQQGAQQPQQYSAGAGATGTGGLSFSDSLLADPLDSPPAQRPGVGGGGAAAGAATAAAPGLGSQ